MKRVTLFLSLLLAASSQVFAANVYVATGGSDSGGDGTQANPFATIETAAEECAEGDSVFVAVGSYSGEIDLPSATPDNLTILPDGTGVVELTRPGGRIFDIDNIDGLTLYDLSLTNASYGIDANDVENLRVLDCTFTAISSKAIYLDNSSNSVGPYISGNEIANGSGYGVYIDRAGAIQSIRDNYIHDLGSKGIYIANNRDDGLGDICSNRIETTSAAIHIVDGGMGRLDSNLVVNSGSHGIYLTNGHESISSICNNIVQNSSGTGIYLKEIGTCASMSQNRVSGNSQKGIQVETNGDKPIMAINGNRIYDNGDHGLMLRHIGSCAEMHDDSLCGNGKWGLHYDGHNKGLASLRNLIVTDNAEGGLYLKKVGVSDGLVASTITNNANDWGIYLNNEERGFARIDSCVISENKRGVHLQKPGEMESISYNTIVNNANGMGLQINDNHNKGVGQLDHNTITGNGGHGLYANKMGASTSISNNTITGNSGAGIMLNNNEDRAVTRISNNILSNSSYSIFAHKAKVSYADNNQMTSTVDWTVYVNDNKDVGLSFCNNTITASTRGAYFKKPGDLVLNNNQITGGTGWALQIDDIHHRSATLQNNTISNYSKGLYLNQAGDFDFSGNTLSQITADYALQVQGDTHADSSKIHNNTLQNCYKGIYLHHAGAVQFTSNTITGTQSDWAVQINDLRDKGLICDNNVVSGLDESRGFYLRKTGDTSFQNNLLSHFGSDRPLYIELNHDTLICSNNSFSNARKGLYFDKVKHGTFSGNTVENLREGWMVQFNNLHNHPLIATDNTISTGQRGFYANDVSDFTFTGNTLQDFSQDYNLWYNGHDGTTEITANRIEDGQRAAYLNKCGDLNFSCNIIADMDNDGVGVYLQHNHPLQVSHNTFHDNTGRHLFLNDARNGNVSSNIFTTCGDEALYVSNQYGDIISCNLFYDNDSDLSYYAELFDDGTNVFANPLFTNIAQGDFSLQTGSPALDAGSDGTDMGGHMCHIVIPDLQAHIVTPVAGGDYYDSVMTQFEASVSGGVEDYTIEWSSSLDGALGTGLVAENYLSPGLHTIYLHVVDAAGTIVDRSVEVEIESEVVEADEHLAVFELKQNYPNPFNPSTTIRFSLAELGHARVTIYNLLGAQVAVLVDDMMEVGHHEVRFNAGNMAGGLYFCVFEAAGHREVNKMTLIK
jgi:parallel beta-helix repeat protein